MFTGIYMRSQFMHSYWVVNGLLVYNSYDLHPVHFISDSGLNYCDKYWSHVYNVYMRFVSNDIIMHWMIPTNIQRFIRYWMLCCEWKQQNIANINHFFIWRPMICSTFVVGIAFYYVYVVVFNAFILAHRSHRCTRLALVFHLLLQHQSYPSFVSSPSYLFSLSTDLSLNTM